MSLQNKKNILVAASGTGGHLFPALSFAEILQQDFPQQFEISFIGSGRPLEAVLVLKAGYPLFQYNITGISKLGIRGLLNFFLILPRAILQVGSILQKTKPALVIGFGGYASVLPVFLARLRGIPTVIFEAEKKAGLANRFLSFFAKTTAAYSEVKGVFGKVNEVGRVLRPAMLNFKKEYCSGAPKNILIMGGSQGCRSIDLALANFLENLSQQVSPAASTQQLSFWHQARAENLELLSSAYEQAKMPAQVVPFIDKPEEAYLWADLIISRSGAGAVMEISVTGLPAILVPLPKAQEQLNNAQLLEAAGKALLVPEGEDFYGLLAQALVSLLDAATYQKFLHQPKAVLNTAGARNLAKFVSNLIAK